MKKLNLIIFLISLILILESNFTGYASPSNETSYHCSQTYNYTLSAFFIEDQDGQNDDAHYHFQWTFNNNAFRQLLDWHPRIFVSKVVSTLSTLSHNPLYLLLLNFRI